MHRQHRRDGLHVRQQRDDGLRQLHLIPQELQATPSDLRVAGVPLERTHDDVHVLQQRCTVVRHPGQVKQQAENDDSQRRLHRCRRGLAVVHEVGDERG